GEETDALRAVPAVDRADGRGRKGTAIDVEPGLATGTGRHADAPVWSLADPLVRGEAARELIPRDRTDVALHPAGLLILVIHERRIRTEVIEPAANGVGFPAFRGRRFRAERGERSVREEKGHLRTSVTTSAWNGSPGPGRGTATRGSPACK